MSSYAEIGFINKLMTVFKTFIAGIFLLRTFALREWIFFVMSVIMMGITFSPLH